VDSLKFCGFRMQSHSTPTTNEEFGLKLATQFWCFNCKITGECILERARGISTGKTKSVERDKYKSLQYFV
jgi:hypothetical protein